MTSDNSCAQLGVQMPSRDTVCRTHSAVLHGVPLCVPPRLTTASTRAACCGKFLRNACILVPPALCPMKQNGP